MINTKPEKDNKHYAKVSAPWQQFIVKHRVGALAVHWIFQGILIMDPTEKLFKLGLDLVLTISIGATLAIWVPSGWAFTGGFLIAHTLNFIFNGQIFGVLKTFGSVQHTWEDFEKRVAQLKSKAASESSILYAAAYGSLAREEWSPTSDLDVRIVRKPGLLNGIKASWFALRARTDAMRSKFPLDLYVVDSFSGLQKMMEHKTPVVLVNKDISSKDDEKND